MSQGPESGSDDDHEWRFGIDDVGPEAEADEPEPEPDPIEPEPISLEHAVFVGLGIVLTVGLVVTAL